MKLADVVEDVMVDSFSKGSVVVKGRARFKKHYQPNTIQNEIDLVLQDPSLISDEFDLMNITDTELQVFVQGKRHLKKKIDNDYLLFEKRQSKSIPRGS